MLLIFSIACYAPNATLVGNIDQQTLKAYFYKTNTPDASCFPLSSKSAIIILSYNAGTGVQTLSSDFIFKVDFNNIIHFKNIYPALFLIIRDLTRISYTINISNTLKYSGNFYEIQYTQQNISNCWGPMNFKYQSIGESSYINFIAFPITCNIIDPLVQFQYFYNDEWTSIDILPTVTNDTDYQGYKLPYNHEKTWFYQMFQKDMDQSQQLLLKSFFKNFEKNRQMQMRVSFTFKNTVSGLVQQIYSLASQIQTDKSDCMDILNLNAIATEGEINDVGNLQRFSLCDQHIKSIQMQSVFIGYQINRFHVLNQLQYRNSITFFFQVANQSVYELYSDQYQQIYMQFYDSSGQKIGEETLSYLVKITCVKKMLPLVRRQNTCLVIFPSLQEYCKDRSIFSASTQIQQILQLTDEVSSRTVYQNFEINFLLPIQSYQLFCLNSYNVSYKNVNLSTFINITEFDKRQKQFINQIKKAIPILIFQNNQDYVFSYNIDIESYNNVLIGIAVTFISILCITILTVWWQLRETDYYEE